jgi:hypothetical protein
MNEVLQTGAEREENQMTNADTTTAAGTAAITPQGAAVTPAPAKPTNKATQKKAAPKAKTGKKAAAAPRKETAKAAGKTQARDGSKKAAVIQLLRRKEGATAGEIAKLTKWQSHTIRGFISGTVSKKMKLTVESARNEQGERVYRVK